MQKSFKDPKPTLYLVSTPIGNLGDMTVRAIEVLNSVDLIYAEDTRTSGVLLNHYQIKTPQKSYHLHNESSKEVEIIQHLKTGKQLALISDAGTPGISDPGYLIVTKVIEAGYHVVSIPGASAALAALTSSGLVIQPFTFLGFLPRKQSEIKQLLETFKMRQETLIIYESPLRIAKSLGQLYEVFGDRKIVLARELTKIHETIIRTTLLETQELEHDTRGEYVLIVEGNHQLSYPDSIDAHVKTYLKQGLAEKDALKQTAKDRNTTKSEIYKAYKIK